VRTLGATAGLAPSALALALVVGLVAAGFGSTPTIVELAVGAGLITAFTAGIGWLVRPSIDGNARDDIAAGVSYLLTACLLYLVIGAIGSAWTEDANGPARDAFGVVVAIGFRFAYGLLYTPLLALIGAPFAVAWVVALRLLRPRFRA